MDATNQGADSAGGARDIRPRATPSIDRQIVRLAVPALGSLVVEPLFLAVDTAMIGHLGTTHLAGLGIASTVLTTVVGLMVFLAYSTTPAVARRFGAGDMRGAVSRGIDSLWFSLVIGAVIAAAGWFAAPTLIGAFGAAADVSAHATTYLSISMLGVPAMLIVFAATGMLRGFQDTVLPLWVAGIGFSANAVLNAIFIYGFGWGVAGSAAGTVLVQWSMVAAYLVVTVRLARKHGASLRPALSGLGGTAKLGGWMFLRTVSLRIAVLATVWVATGLGTDELAGWQIVFTLVTLTALALDALAIAAQALIGKELGAADAVAVRRVLRQTTRWGLWCGVACGVVIAAASPVLGIVFTGEQSVAALILPALLVLAVTQPLAAWVFVLDGVLMGAGDARYLALAGAVNLVIYLPALLWLGASDLVGSWALALLAGAFCGVFMAARALTLGLRVLGTAWLRQ